ncbi:MAG: hypothetical protein PF589_06300 [Gammaproteobacteria bacterium]|jgi:hypothetical protein|nr:hypothetical protein [Gammaproteobacteria bacterium]
MNEAETRAELIDPDFKAVGVVDGSRVRREVITLLKQSLLQKAFSGELPADKAAPNTTLKEEKVA